MTITCRLYEREWDYEDTGYHRAFFVECIISFPKVPSLRDSNNCFEYKLEEENGYGICFDREDIKASYGQREVNYLPKMLEELEKLKNKVLSELPFDETQAE